jgi:hypothetical protein
METLRSLGRTALHQHKPVIPGQGEIEVDPIVARLGVAFTF